MKLIISIAVLGSTVLLGWIACKSGNGPQESRPAVEAESLLAELSIEPVNETLAPDFLLYDFDGKRVRLKELRGKVVLLNFWATWCPSCRFEMPSMELLHQQYSSQGLAVLAVDLQEGKGEVRSFFREHDLTFPGLLDPSAEVFALYKAWSLPTTFVINKRGFIVGKAVGYRDWHSEQSKAFFAELLKETA